MQAVVGTDPKMYQTGVGVFTPGTPLASDAGLASLTGPRSMDRAKALMKEAGYTNQPMRLIGPTDILAPSAMTQVGADLVRRLGFNADIALSDWGTTVTRRASREPLDKGGWSMLFTTFSSVDFVDPSAHFPLRGNGAGAWFGWPDMPRLEELRDAWFDADDLPAQQRIAREMQTVAMKFELQYTRMIDDVDGNIESDDLQSRISSGADYFGKQLKVISELFGRTQLASDNKMIAKRIKDRTQQFEEELKIKTSVLAYAASDDDGFSISGYLHAKDIAAIDDEKRGKKKKEKKPKEKKERVDTKRVSYEMFCSGKSLNEIAVERLLSKVTIEGHLAHYVETGDIPVEKLMSYDKYNRIVAYLTTHPDNVSQLSTIKEGLGSDYSYAEIKFALAAYRHDS